MMEKQEKIFMSWVNKHNNLIFKIVRTYANAPQDQEDLFQEILLQLWCSMHNFHGYAKETTWIYRVALNTSLIWNRSKINWKKKKYFKFDFINQQNFGGSVQDNQILKQLYNSIRQLSKSESSIILMYLDGLSYNEISDILGITNNNVGVKINRAKKNLTKLMKGLVDEF